MLYCTIVYKYLHLNNDKITDLGTATQNNPRGYTSWAAMQFYITYMFGHRHKFNIAYTNRNKNDVKVKQKQQNKQITNKQTNTNSNNFKKMRRFVSDGLILVRIKDSFGELFFKSVTAKSFDFFIK